MKNKFKLILIALSALLLASGALFCNKAYKAYMHVKSERDSYKNNTEVYVNLLNGKLSENRVLRLDNLDLIASNDKMIQDIEKYRKSLKKPVNKPGSISIGTTVSISDTDTLDIKNPTKFKIDTTIYFNELTRNRIQIDENKLISSIDINNSMFLYVYPRREYANKRRNWLDRLVHLDYRKENFDEYSIVNTNKKIVNDSVRVIKVRE